MTTKNMNDKMHSISNTFIELARDHSAKEYLVFIKETFRDAGSSVKEHFSDLKETFRDKGSALKESAKNLNSRIWCFMNYDAQDIGLRGMFAGATIAICGTVGALSCAGLAAVTGNAAILTAANYSFFVELGGGAIVVGSAALYAVSTLVYGADPF
jgi:phage-related protein